MAAEVHRSMESVISNDELLAGIFKHVDKQALYGILPLICRRWSAVAALLQEEVAVRPLRDSVLSMSLAVWVARHGRRLTAFRFCEDENGPPQNRGSPPFYYAPLVSLASLAPPPQLYELKLHCHFEEAFDALRFLAPACRYLRVLDLAANDDADIRDGSGLFALISASLGLQSLSLSCISLPSDPESGLVTFPPWPAHLTSLHMRHVDREDISNGSSWASLARLTGLRSLTWEGNLSSEPALNSLCILTLLTHLALNALDSVQQFQTLTSGLRGLKRLRHLVLDSLTDYDYGFDDWDPREGRRGAFQRLYQRLLTAVASLTRLTFLSLADNPELTATRGGPENVSRVLTALQSLQQLRHLNISRTGLGDVSPLTALTQLTSLEAVRNGLRRDQVEDLLPWLCSCRVEAYGGGDEEVSLDTSDDSFGSLITSSSSSGSSSSSEGEDDDL